MSHQTFCTFGNSAALQHAASALWSYGWEYDASASVLLLPVPSFDSHNRVKGGGRVEDILTKETIVIGGNLDHPALINNKCIDLLKDPYYLSMNSLITAHCAIKVAYEHLHRTISDCNVLVVGWGRIGKCLANLLKGMGAKLTVSARSEADRALLKALGYEVINVADPNVDLKHYNIIYNTVPAEIIKQDRVCKRQLKIDLASIQGIEGDDVIHARGLPGIYAPESSGILIAQTIDRLGKELLV